MSDVIHSVQQTYVLANHHSTTCCCQGTGAASAGVAASDEPLVVPEDIGRAAAQLLLDEVARGGVTDGTHQALLLLLAALGPEEMNQVLCHQARNSGRFHTITQLLPC